MGTSMSSCSTLQDPGFCTWTQSNVTNSTQGVLSHSQLASDPDVAGVGVVYAFAITSLLTMLISTGLMWPKATELWNGNGHENIKKNLKAERIQNKTGVRHIFEAVVLGLSDQQLVTGLATQIATLMHRCNLTAYHFNIICYSVLMSIITHLGSLVTQTHYFRNPYLGGFRMLLIFMTFILTGWLFGIRNTGNFPVDKVPEVIVPTVCFNANATNIVSQLTDAVSTGKKLSSGLVQFIFLTICFFLAITMAMLHSHRIRHKHAHLTQQRISYGVRAVVLLMCWSILIWAVVNLFGLRQWMQQSEWIQDQNEMEWSFGQLVPVLLIGLGLYAVAEAWNDWRTEQPFVQEKGANRQSYTGI